MGSKAVYGVRYRHERHRFVCEDYGVTQPWKVESVEVGLEKMTVEVGLGIERGWEREVEGVKIGAISDRMKERRWKLLDSCQFRTVLIAREPRVQLGDGRVVGVGVPWAAAFSRPLYSHQRLLAQPGRALLPGSNR